MDTVKLRHNSAGWSWWSKRVTGNSELCKSGVDSFFKVPKGTRAIDVVISKQKPKDCEEVYFLKHVSANPDFFVWNEIHEFWVRLPLMGDSYRSFVRLIRTKWELSGPFYLWVEA